jgi:hypothetical protein
LLRPSAGRIALSLTFARRSLRSKPPNDTHPWRCIEGEAVQPPSRLIPADSDRGPDSALDFFLPRELPRKVLSPVLPTRRADGTRVTLLLRL